MSPLGTVPRVDTLSKGRCLKVCEKMGRVGSGLLRDTVIVMHRCRPPLGPGLSPWVQLRFLVSLQVQKPCTPAPHHHHPHYLGKRVGCASLSHLWGTLPCKRPSLPPGPGHWGTRLSGWVAPHRPDLPSQPTKLCPYSTVEWDTPMGSSRRGDRTPQPSAPLPPLGPVIPTCESPAKGWAGGVSRQSEVERPPPLQPRCASPSPRGRQTGSRLDGWLLPCPPSYRPPGPYGHI